MLYTLKSKNLLTLNVNFAVLITIITLKNQIHYFSFPLIS